LAVIPHPVPADRGKKESGETGKLRRLFLEVILGLQFVAHALPGLRFALHRVIPAISGCFRPVCNRFSTVPAQLLLASRFEDLRAAVAARRSRAGTAAVLDGAAACYTRYSSDNQDEKSIEDQLRECREAAARNSYAIPDSLHFSDAAVSGATVVRDGLDDLREAARHGRIQILFVHSLSRLSRETTFGLPLLKELNVVNGVRIISVSEGIDSDQPLWYEMAMISSLQNERYLKELAANTRRGLVGTVVSPYSCGDYVFGYTSVPSPDGATRRRGGIPVPRRIYAIEPANSKWVVLIFVWFAIEGRSKSWIARQLTRLKVPKDHRATVAQWSPQNVDAVLRNEKYIGKWPWGRTKRTRNPITGKCKQESRPVEEISEDWLREHPHLRLIDDELLQKANARLELAAAQFAEHRNSDGTLAGSNTLRPVAHALQNLIRCAKCNRPFIRAGQRKAYLRCSGSLRNQCVVRAALRRDLATTLIRDAAETRLLKNPAFLDAVFAATLEQWRKSVADQPDALFEAETQKVSIEQKIARIERQIENDDDPPPNLLRLLKERNNELQDLTRQIESLRKQSSTPQPEPTREWIANQIRDRFLGDLASGVPSHIEAFQALFAEPIVVRECERLNRRRCYLRVTLCFDSEQLSGLLMGTSEASPSESVREVVELDIRPKRRSDDQARLAHSMWGEGASCDEIAQALTVSRSRVTALFDHAAKELGLPKPDTRGRRPLSEVQKQIEPEVVARYEAGALLDEIAKAVGASRPTVDRCLARWLKQQGLPKVDGRTRRKTLLLRRSSKPTLSLGSADPSPSKSEAESEERIRDDCSPPECGGSAA